MPELPEVETICRGLQQVIVGKRIEQVAIHQPQLRLPIPPSFPEKTAGRKIEAVSRRAKYIDITLEEPAHLLIHFGMSGRFRIYAGKRPEREKHDHVVFSLSDGITLVYHDPRRFGLITYCEPAGLSQHILLRNLGIEPFSPVFTGKWLWERLQTKVVAIKKALMDASLVVGIGNIYASEALFRACISPEKSAKTLTRQACDRLVDAVREVLAQAIEAGGSTLKDFSNPDGNSGYFQHAFQVYGRENEACIRCKKSIKKIKQAGRSTFYCPQCQKGGNYG